MDFRPLKMALTRYLLEPPIRFEPARLTRFHEKVALWVLRKAIGKSAEICKPKPFNPSSRELGRDWPPEAETMVGMKRLNQFHEAMEVIDAEAVPGDVLEAGIWRGGVVIFAAAFLRHQNPYSTRVIAAVSFEGLPKPDDRYPVDLGDRHHLADALRVSKSEVLANFQKYGISADSVDFLEGWFEDTLPAVGNRNLAILRLDGDMYSSTRHI